MPICLAVSHPQAMEEAWRSVPTAPLILGGSGLEARGGGAQPPLSIQEGRRPMPGRAGTPPQHPDAASAASRALHHSFSGRNEEAPHTLQRAGRTGGVRACLGFRPIGDIWWLHRLSLPILEKQHHSSETQQRRWQEKSHRLQTKSAGWQGVGDAAPGTASGPNFSLRAPNRGPVRAGERCRGAPRHVITAPMNLPFHLLPGVGPSLESPGLAPFPPELCPGSKFWFSLCRPQTFLLTMLAVEMEVPSPKPHTAALGCSLWAHVPWLGPGKLFNRHHPSPCLAPSR